MMQDQGDMDIVDERSVARNNEMEDARSKTLKSLDCFMQAQRALFQRTQADIERLRELKKRADVDPISTLESFLKRPSASTTSNESSASTSESGFLASLNFPSLKELGAEVRKYNKDSIIHAIDWRLFSGHDPTKLREMAASIRKAHPTSVYPTPLPPPRPPPHIPNHDLVSSMDTTYPPPLPNCHSKESDLQRLVRIQRKLIVEPALESSATFLASFPDSDSEPCPESAVSAGRGKLGPMRNGRKSKNKAREQNKANARRRRSGTSNANCISTVRQRGPGGIFVKRDTEDIIDIDVVDSTSQLPSPLLPPTPSTVSWSRPQRRNLCSASTSMDIDLTSVDPASIAASKPSRTRRPSMRLRDGYGLPSDIVSETNTNVAVESPSNTSIPPTPSTAVFQEPRPVIKLKIRLPPRRPVADKHKTHDESAKTRENSTSRSVSQSTRSASRSISTPVDVSGPENEDEDDDEGEDEVTAEEESVSEDEAESEINRTRVNGGGKNQKKSGGKPKPATFNLPWTVEEQHHLEQLLKEIPDGEQRRWAKISGRMKGRRTPRQVASRVQKYNLKLKKFGLDLG